MIERYKKYSEMHENVKKAITCIISNPCNNLKDEIVKIKNQIDGITLSEWKDSSSVEFRICKNECSLKLGTIITSISNVFKYSEKIYDLLNKQLDNFKIVDDNYENVLKEKPNQSDYQKTVVENGISKTVNDTLAYESAYDYWQSVMTEIETAIRECVKKIEEYVQELDEINNLTITMSASLPYITETASAVYVPKEIVYNNSKLKLASNMVLYEYNDSMYYVIDTPGYEYSKIPLIHGKQPRNKCDVWSDYYAKDIFKNSESVPIISTYKGLISQDKSEILQIMATEILSGRPSVIHVTGVHQNGEIYKRHFVTVAGIKDGADLTNLKESDFLIMDPTLPGLKPLDTEKVNYTTRSLLACENATHRLNNNKGYAILIYNDPKLYVTETCKEAKI